MVKATILIVEDEQIVAMDLRNDLENNGFKIVGQTNNGNDAILKATELNPDLVMMDIGLKGEIDGVEAAMKIREQFNLPVIFLTAFANDATIERARLAEPYGYILKPFEIQEVTIAIEMALYKHGMENKLRESENKFRSVIEQATDGIALLDGKGEIIEWNPSIERITGLNRSVTIGKPIWKITFKMSTKEDKKAVSIEKHAAMWQSAIENGYSENDDIVERVIETPQGEQKIIQSNGFVVKANHNVNAGVIIRDVTEIKILEQKEQDQRMLAEALLDTAMALNSTLRLDEILDRILENVGKLIVYDSAMVLLIEENRVRRIRYKNNPQDSSTKPVLGDVDANLINVPILDKIMKTKKPYHSNDIQADERWKIIATQGMKRIRSLICAPILIGNKVMGLINIISGTPDFFTLQHTERIMAFANQAAVAFENARLFEQAEHLSLTDPLTNLYNMRYMYELAKRELELNRRHSRTFSLAMIDIDHFKNVNDKYGHKTGDMALREISARILKSVRTVDIVARYGGEEFIVLMPETGSEEAFQIAERIRLNVAESQIEDDDQKFSLTLSIGIAETKENIQVFDDLLFFSDKALYAAKDAGRNQTVIVNH